MRIPILCMSAGSRAWLQTHSHPPLTARATVYYSATFWPSIIKNTHLSLSRLHVTTELQSGHPYRLHFTTRLVFPSIQVTRYIKASLAVPNANLSLLHYHSGHPKSGTQTCQVLHFAYSFYTNRRIRPWMDNRYLGEAQSYGTWQTEPSRTGGRAAQHYRPLQLSSMDGQQVSANFILHCLVVDSLTLKER